MHTRVCVCVYLCACGCVCGCARACVSPRRGLWAPSGVVETVAGLALLGALAGALQGAVTATTSDATRSADTTAAVLTLVVAASGTTIAGIESAFWALLAGLVARWWLLRGTPIADRAP